jgi:hypothetical protein
MLHALLKVIVGSDDDNVLMLSVKRACKIISIRVNVVLVYDEFHTAGFTLVN